MIEKKRRRSKQDKLREANAKTFIGREEPLRLFRNHLNCGDPDSPDFIDILNIHGQGGVGKTFLCEKLRDMATGHNVIPAYVDEGVEGILDCMHQIAKQFEDKGFPLKTFSERYKVYLKEKKELEMDPEAPSGWASFLTKTIVKGGLTMADGATAGLTSMIDKKEAAESASELISYLRKKKKNKMDEVELLLHPEDVLTPLFLDDLWEHEEDHNLCLFIDNYETTSILLDDWLLKLSSGKYGDTPLNLTLIISGRNYLDKNKWTPLKNMVQNVSLEPFTDDEAQAYLNGRGIEAPGVIYTICKLSNNLPILLATLSEAAPTTIDEVQDASGTAVERFLRWIKDPIRQELALQASLARHFNRDVVAELIPDDQDAAELFDWLCERPFVQKRGGQWAYHPVVRELMMRHLKDASPQSWDQTHYNKLGQYYFNLMLSLLKDRSEHHLTELYVDRDDVIKDEQWQSWALEYYYHFISARPKEGFPCAIRQLVATLRILRYEKAISWMEIISEALGTEEKRSVIIQNGVEGIIEDDHQATLIFFDMIKDLDVHDDKEDSNFIYFQIGLRNQYLEKNRDSISAYRKAINIKPDHASSWYNLGILLSHQGNLNGAVEAYNKAIDIKPDDASAWSNLGNVLKTQGALEGAVEAYNKAIDIKPDHAGAWYNLGNVLKAQSNSRGAVEAYKKAIDIKPDDANTWSNLGNVLKAQGDLEGAVEAYNKAINIKRDLFEPWYNLGIAFLAQGDLGRAVVAYKKAIEIKPDDVSTWYNLGIALRARRDLEGAIKAYNKALEIKPDNAAVWYNLGNTFYDQRDLERAIEAYKKAIEIKPDDSSAWSNLGNAHYHQGDLEGAIEAYEKAIESTSNSARYVHPLGWLYLTQHNFKEASKYLFEAWELSEEKDSHASMNLGHVELLQGDDSKAIEWYQKSIPFWKKVEKFFEGMESDYTDLRMAELGITKEAYDQLLQTLRDGIS